MKLINKVLCVAVVIALSLANMHVYGFTNGVVQPGVCESKNFIESKYGVKLIFESGVSFQDIEKSMPVLEKSLGKFPEGLIKEITDTYLNKGISTNIIICKTDYDLNKTSAEYEITDHNINFTINLLINDFYAVNNILSMDGFMHLMGSFITDYLFEYYGYDLLDREFKRLNGKFEYGTWNSGYEKVFVKNSSASGLKNDISDLIWYAEAYPDKLRSINLKNKEIIHKKIEYLSQVMDECFDSVNEETKLWLDALPDYPDKWAEKSIEKMRKEGLIPKEFSGKYETYISREDFYILSLNLIKTHLGNERFYEHFNISEPVKSYTIDPISGETIFDNCIPEAEFNIDLCDSIEEVYEAYKLGLINCPEEVTFNTEEEMTKLDAVKLAVLICEKFGMDIKAQAAASSVYNSELTDAERAYVSFAAENGILTANIDSLEGYCTYQEAYIMLGRVYDLLSKL